MKCPPFSKYLPSSCLTVGLELNRWFPGGHIPATSQPQQELTPGIVWYSPERLLWGFPLILLPCKGCTALVPIAWTLGVVGGVSVVRLRDEPHVPAFYKASPRLMNYFWEHSIYREVCQNGTIIPEPPVANVFLFLFFFSFYKYLHLIFPPELIEHTLPTSWPFSLEHFTERVLTRSCPDITVVQWLNSQLLSDRLIKAYLHCSSCPSNVLYSKQSKPYWFRLQCRPTRDIWLSLLCVSFHQKRCASFSVFPESEIWKSLMDALHSWVFLIAFSQLSSHCVSLAGKILLWKSKKEKVRTSIVAQQVIPTYACDANIPIWSISSGPGCSASNLACCSYAWKSSEQCWVPT